MNVHKNARTTVPGRLLMVRRVLVEHRPPAEVAADFGVSTRTVYKWLAGYRAEALRPWTAAYNRHRPHAALNRRPPFGRLSREQPTR